ncbi:hypothetical protein E1161_13455 [Saccharopolyspora aridisoli]|uniref:Uncharacterized protein n=1 Tax=Saccharopolyspora aridisoli TaxID=2530385 RepID=A0A4R4UUL3_9PSEU|nr:hypothetical protein [Saccharopolyspora aridisoli]TDC92373.1 hypothetical protein E1161_13455 [Saccharopolyspora aridisoli]
MSENTTVSATEQTEPLCQSSGGAHRPDDMPDKGDRCKDCGRPITWLGPSMYDWELAYSPEPLSTVDRFPAERIDAESVEDLAEIDFDGEGDMLYGNSPEDHVHDNSRRAGFAVPALEAFTETTRLHGENIDLVVADLLADLLHLCDALSLDFDELVKRGYEHYSAEVTGNWA